MSHLMQSDSHFTLLACSGHYCSRYTGSPMQGREIVRGKMLPLKWSSYRPPFTCRFPGNYGIKALLTASDKTLGKKFHDTLDKLPLGTRDNPEMQAIFEEMEQAAKSHEYYQVAQNGSWRNVYSTLAQVASDCTVSLGTLSFQQFGPQDQTLSVAMEGGDGKDSGRIIQGVTSDKEYTFVTGFRVADGEHEGVLGQFCLTGTFSVEDAQPHRQKVHFEKLRLEPQEGFDLEKWKAFAKDSNKGMDDNGIAEVTLPKPINGWRDFIYVDKDQGFQVTKGNLGSYVALTLESK